MFGMWWLVVTLTFTAGTAHAVSSRLVTFPSTLELGEDYSLSFAQEDDGVSYTLNKKSGTTSEKALIGGTEINRGIAPPEYHVKDCTTEIYACVELAGKNFTITFETDVSRAADIAYVTLESDSPDTHLGFRVRLEENVQWFGGPEARRQLWPIQDSVWNDISYVTKEISPTIAMSIAEPYWVNSRGAFIYIISASSLFLDQNNRYNDSIYLYAENKSPFRRQETTHIRYASGTASDPRSAHESASEIFFPRPTSIPHETVIARPIWSTWARYKSRINESQVRDYAKEIIDHGFKYSQLEIDDFWEECYGTLDFDASENKFPNITKLTDDLHDLGFMVSLWVTPFINLECETVFEEALEKGYLVRNVDENVNATWWQGNSAGVIDFTNEEAVKWYTDRLRTLKSKAGIDYYKFDAGETSWLPTPANLTGDIEKSPNLFTTEYVRAVAAFGNGSEVRSGYQTQDLDIMVRMLDKDSDWTLDNGLPTLINTLLVLNMAGYGFVLPDMVGGNGVKGSSLVDTELPSKELFIRWLQANTFMPVIQYSIVPWDYDEETVKICLKYTELHEEYAPTIIEAMNATVATGAPVNPPVWWVDPLNTEAHKIKDQYMLGEVIVVAPVVEEGATSRNIFLPTGSWRDATNHNLYVGPTWLYNYSAPLDVLPYFVEEEYWKAHKTSAASYATSSLMAVFTSALLALAVKLF